MRKLHQIGGRKYLRPVRASAAIESRYQHQLERLVDQMCRSVMYWLRATYRSNEDRIVTDATPASELQRRIRDLRKQWDKKFADAADRLARYFAQDVDRRSAVVLRNILKEGGFTVEFQTTAGIRNIMEATIHENVGLIKSIPQQFLNQVEGIVMRGVQKGGDLQQITEDLQKQFGVTRRRASLIARDQNRKAQAAFNRQRHLDLGIEEAEWVHSGGGHEPRKSHVKAGKDRTRYRIAEGWWDPDEGKFIQPGELINCRCTSRPIIPGLSS